MPTYARHEGHCNRLAMPTGPHYWVVHSVECTFLIAKTATDISLVSDSLSFVKRLEKLSPLPDCIKAPVLQLGPAGGVQHFGVIPGRTLDHRVNS